MTAKKLLAGWSERLPTPGEGGGTGETRDIDRTRGIEPDAAALFEIAAAQEGRVDNRGRAGWIDLGHKHIRETGIGRLDRAAASSRDRPLSITLPASVGCSNDSL